MNEPILQIATFLISWLLFTFVFLVVYQNFDTVKSVLRFDFSPLTKGHIVTAVITAAFVAYLISLSVT